MKINIINIEFVHAGGFANIDLSTAADQTVIRIGTSLELSEIDGLTCEEIKSAALEKARSSHAWLDEALRRLEALPQGAA